MATLVTLKQADPYTCKAVIVRNDARIQLKEDGDWIRITGMGNHPSGSYRSLDEPITTRVLCDKSPSEIVTKMKEYFLKAYNYWLDKEERLWKENIDRPNDMQQTLLLAAATMNTNITWQNKDKGEGAIHLPKIKVECFNPGELTIHLLAIPADEACELLRNYRISGSIDDRNMEDSRQFIFEALLEAATGRLLPEKSKKGGDN